MDSLQKSVNEMMTMFVKRMEDFEGGRNKDTASTSSAPSVTPEFTAFKAFVMEALKTLQSQVSLLMRSVDYLEMRGRRKILLIHGIPEEQQEDSTAQVVNVIKNKLNLSDFQEEDIRNCHRLGRPVNNKSRPILFELKDLTIRSDIWMAKTKLKGSGITLSEFLTKYRHSLFMSARQRFGVSNCWTRDGIIHVAGGDGKRHRISRSEDLDSIIPLQQKPVALAKELPKTRRQAGKK